MRKIILRLVVCVVLSVSAFSLTGCTIIFQKGRRKDVRKIAKLQNEYSKLQDELSALERAKIELESRLKGEIDDKEVKVEMLERGLVITFVAEVLFDSGKAVLRDEALYKLDKVSRVLNTTVKDLNVGVEGHTDSIPIKHSGWKSNWELSSARAMSVLHYMIEEHEVAPGRLSATGFGEYHPVESNDTEVGRQKNRRVEIVILPKTTKQEASHSTENLK
ncbi:MAG: OmpA family protein [Candidatus Omnitrophica bacterium]|nr:OmpA family protein [Candidatus Omnitrophota bacterium]